MNKLDNKKAVIFDLDGTLIDTEKVYSQVWPKAVADMGYTMTHEQYLSLRSLGRPYAPLKLKEYFGEDFDYDMARSIRKKYFNAYIAEHGIERKNGAIELLTHLRNKGIITAIATATDMERATSYLESVSLTSYFDKVISATMVEEGKPSPKVYAYACKELGLSPSDCVAVEDAPNGVLSAYRAGLSVIMVPDLSLPDEELQSLLSACVPTLLDIIPLM